MSDADLRDLAAAYAIGALDQDEARAFEQLLAQSPELGREVARFRDVSALLAHGAAPATPSPGLKGLVLERIARERGTGGAPRAARTAWLHRLAWAAAVVGIVGAVVFAARARDVASRVAALERQRDSLAAQLAESEEALGAILGAGTVQFRLTSPSDPQPGMQVFWNRDTNVWVLHATALAPAPAGRVYQLWFLRGSEAVPASTFNTRADGQVIVTVPGPTDRAGLTGAAITEEPSGGSPQPTSTPILVGAVQAE